MKKGFRWGTYLFVLLVFMFGIPYDLSYSVKEYSGLDRQDADEEVRLVARGSVQRRIALFSLGAYGVVLLVRRKKRELHINGILGWLLLFYALIAVLSIAWADDTSLTLRRVGILIILLVGALAITKQLSLHENIVLVFFVCGVTLCIAVVAEIMFKTFQPFNPSWRFAGVLHPVSQGWNCGLLSLAGFALWKSSARRSAIYLAIALVALCFLVLTRSRMAFVTSLLSVGLYWYFFLRKSGKVGLLFVIGLIISASIICVLLDRIPNTNEILRIVSFGRGDEGKSSISELTGRIPLWKECLRYAANRPLLGYGYGGFFSPKRILDISEAIGWVPSNCHSGYMEILVGIGIVGGISLVMILALALKMSIRLVKSNFDYGFVAALLVWVCCNMLLESFFVTPPSFPSFICYTLLVRLGYSETHYRDGENKGRSF